MKNQSENYQVTLNITKIGEGLQVELSSNVPIPTYLLLESLESAQKEIEASIMNDKVNQCKRVWNNEMTEEDKLFFEKNKDIYSYLKKAEELPMLLREKFLEMIQETASTQNQKMDSKINDLLK